MTKTKFTVLILILLTLGLVVSGCLKKPVVNQDQNTNIVVNQNLNTNTQQEATLSEPDEAGWRTHINPLAGFMFKFQDAEKKIKLQVGDGDGSVFIEDDGSKDGRYLYISRYDYDFNSYLSDKPTNFRELIEKVGWQSVDSAQRLISLERITYPNIEEGYIAIVEHNFGYIAYDIYIQDPNKKNEFIKVTNTKLELYTQVLQTFQFLPLP